MDFSRRFVALCLLLFLPSVGFAALPSSPIDPAHPGSQSYEYEVESLHLTLRGRAVEVFLPTKSGVRLAHAPVIVFGHGQAIGVEGYAKTFEHLAKKGLAVIFPTYDTGFFDQEWRRMGQDFNNLAKDVLLQFAQELDGNSVIYSGHSKGAYVALVAAGTPNAGLTATAVLLFAPAGYDQQYIKNLDRAQALTLVWGEADTIIKRNLQEEIYRAATTDYKQLITVKTYPGAGSKEKADHFFVLSEPSLMGGYKGTSAYHYFGAWKWLWGAAQDVRTGAHKQNEYLYGGEALLSGVIGHEHQLLRSW